MQRSNVSIILVRPKNPGNVGSVARAMKNTGLADLVLINPCDLDNPEARMMAVGDRSILGKARVFKSLKEALGPYRWVVATTRRARRRFYPVLTPSEVAAKIASLPKNFKAAVVFGPEDHGLSNAQTALCQNVSTIPTHAKFSSFNLAQAVMIYAYEINLARLNRPMPGKESLARVEALEALYRHFKETLSQIQYFNRGKPETLMESIRSFLGRACLSPRDVRILRGILGTVQRRTKL